MVKAIELFCGIGGFRLALDGLGYPTVFANDLNDRASKVYTDRFGSAAFVKGDIYQYLDRIPDHDLLTAGFPCQPFSSAGKKMGIADLRGSLFQTIVTILQDKKPQCFILENVKRLISMDRGIHFATILDALSSCGYVVEWRVINAFQFGLSQSRERIIITGYRSLEMPSKIHLIEQIENVVLVKDFHQEKNWFSLSDRKQSFSNWGVCANGSYFSQHVEYFKFVAEKKLKDILEVKVSNEFDFTESTKLRIADSDYVNKFFNGVKILYNQKGGARMGYSIFGTDGIAPTLTSTASRHYERYKVDDCYRRLTNVEYARIQGFPDAHCDAVSVYHQYSLFGNAVPPIMVSWAIERLTKNLYIKMDTLQNQRQLELLVR